MVVILNFKRNVQQIVFLRHGFDVAKNNFGIQDAEAPNYTQNDICQIFISNENAVRKLQQN